MSDPFLAEIIMFAGNFNPRGWAFCDGQLLSISQNSALFSLLGTVYGGDGRVTFGLPELRGRVAMHPGTGPGLPSYRLPLWRSLDGWIWERVLGQSFENGDREIWGVSVAAWKSVIVIAGAENAIDGDWLQPAIWTGQPATP